MLQGLSHVRERSVLLIDDLIILAQIVMGVEKVGRSPSAEDGSRLASSIKIERKKCGKRLTRKVS